MEKSADKAEKPDLDIDFENFTVAPERAGGIRGLIASLKTSGWIDQWKTLLHELGRDETPTGETAPKLPGITADATARVFTIEDPAHTAAGLTIVLQGPDLKVFHNETVLVELSALPKEDDYAIFFVDQDRYLELTDMMNAIEPELKAARAHKSARGSTWKDRFAKNAPST